jgi:sugar/nucleoside kinase (ribokinase family)
VRPLAVIGHLSHDVVAGGAPRIGGGPWHAARALRALREDAVLFAKCGEPERRRFQRDLAATGLVTSFSFSGATTAFSMSYDEHGARTMSVEAVGEPWCASDLQQELLHGVEWLQVAPLLRSDFDANTLARLARGRQILLDGQGLVRVPKTGPLTLDADYDPDLLRHVTILKLGDDEARAIVGDGDIQSLASLGVPEVVVTFGLEGALVLARGSATHVPARALHVDPTGAGDAFAAAYLAARAARHAPVSAARRATAVVSALLSGSIR